ncbi:peroxide stress protein YaaA [Chitinilyticum litopenaei]|uniref:peroxide stress protein YaaA n=1 Tax=Chitinilyticum litopenaei TaxID=1121276 RepID=UPI00048BD814|nr:peroxide stress protein YaaA [Chitinilyticum litopenaei]
MLMLVSPAKTLDYTSAIPAIAPRQPAFMAQAAELIALLRPLTPAQLGVLMHISDELAVLNAGRYQSWQPHATPDNARAAVFAFMGDVYEGLNAGSLDATQLDYLDGHLRILSGLYGLLHPYDLLQAYRLEMGTKLANPAGKDLYAFWGERITAAIRALAPGVVVNLASEEYFKAVKPKLLDCPVITPVFEDYKGGRYKIISFYAKRARGLMVRYAALHGITQATALQQFDLDGYRFVPGESDAQRWLFRRRLSD